MKMLPLMIATLIVAACSRQGGDASGMPRAQDALPAAVAPAPQTEVTRDEWKKALLTAFTEDEVERGDDGLTTFLACFGGDAKNCLPKAFAKRDAFRKLIVFEPVGSRMRRYGGTKYLHSYVSVVDCSPPLVMLNPSFFSKGDWIFLERVAVMADDEVVLDRTLAHNDVQRDNASHGITEASTWIASESEIAALRKASTASSLIIRLTGQKGFATVEKADLPTFKQDAADVISMLDRLTTSTQEKMPKSCN